VYKDIKKRIRRCLALADRLVVTTEALAAGLRSMSDDIQVVPNYLDDSIWQDLRSTRNVSRKPRVGWAGAQQHLGDLEMIEEVVKCTAEEVDWVFFGMCPDCLRPFAKEVHDAVRFEEYPEKLARLNLDLAVAPLERNRFNEAKSNLRILEYGVLGWPVVASDIEPFKDAPVCLVRNQPRAWINAIRERAHDVESAWREGDRLRAWVHENWMLSQHLAEWEHVIDKHTNAGNTSVRGGRATA
jgi:glycosyltransferase involved in cell wall biosynthesis